MNIHEYQAKQVLKGFGAPVAAGVAITSADQAEAAAQQLPGPLYVEKSQIHAGRDRGAEALQDLLGRVLVKGQGCRLRGRVGVLIGPAPSQVQPPVAGDRTSNGKTPSADERRAFGGRAGGWTSRSGEWPSGWCCRPRS